MPLPASGMTVGRALAALERMLGNQPFEIVTLGGVRDEELLDIELRERDSRGMILRIFRAPRAQVLPEGPSLLLLDGEVEVDGEARPFWRGSTRLPLPGSSYAAWLSALFG